MKSEHEGGLTVSEAVEFIKSKFEAIESGYDTPEQVEAYRYGFAVGWRTAADIIPGLKDATSEDLEAALKDESIYALLPTELLDKEIARMLAEEKEKEEAAE